MSLLNDNTIYQEMMCHLVLFSHPHPKNLAILGNNIFGIMKEAIKHPEVVQISCFSRTPSLEKIEDKRIKLYTENINDALTPPTDLFDVIILSEEFSADQLKHIFHRLKDDGILAQACGSPFETNELKKLQITLTNIGFRDTHFFNFSQPNFNFGWRSAIMARKYPHFKRIREKDIFNRKFTTHYYNFDIHRAALALPEFMREELEPSE